MGRIETIKQRDIYWADLGPTQGHEQAGLRPVIVVQDNPLNLTLSTVIIVPLTTNLRAHGLMITHFLDREKTGLKKDSVALLYQVRTIDKRKLLDKIGRVDQDIYFEIRFKLIQNVW